MAILRKNTIVKGMSGMIGCIVFRQYGDKTIVSSKPRSPRKQSQSQRENRLKFKLASHWAQTILLVPGKKEYYTQQAVKLKLPNAYTAALSEHLKMQKNQIE